MRCITYFQNVGLPHEYSEASINLYAASIASSLNRATAVSELAAMWNEALLQLLNLERDHPSHKVYVEKYHEEHFFIGPKLFFAVLNLFLQDSDTVVLHMPPGVSHQVFMVGWRLCRGTLIVHGGVGSIAYEATGSARITLNGNADDAGSGIDGDASLEVNGTVRNLAQNAHGSAVIKVHGDVSEMVGLNAYGSLVCEIYGNAGPSVAVNARENARFYIQGDVTASSGETLSVGSHAHGHVNIHVTGHARGGAFGGVGIEATDNTVIQIDGDVGDLVGCGASKDARIIVRGNAGDRVGEKAQGNAHIEIYGNAGKDVGKRAYRKATIIVHGQAEAGIPGKSFAGVLSINGRKLH